MSSGPTSSIFLQMVGWVLGSRSTEMVDQPWDFSNSLEMDFVPQNKSKSTGIFKTSEKCAGRRMRSDLRSPMGFERVGKLKGAK